MDLSNLGSLAGTLAAQNAPLLGNLFTTVATMAGGALGGLVAGPLGAPIGSSVAGMAAKAVTALILGKLGDGLGVPPDPAAINAAIVANPAASAPVVQQIENDHADIIKTTLDAANRQLEIETADTQNARGFGEAMTAAGPNWTKAVAALAAPLLGIIIVIGFISVTLAVITHAVDQGPTAIYLITTLGSAFLTLVFYYYGTSQGSATKTEHLADLARAPTVQAQPGSNVHTGSVKGGR